MDSQSGEMVRMICSALGLTETEYQATRARQVRSVPPSAARDARAEMNAKIGHAIERLLGPSARSVGLKTLAPRLTEGDAAICNQVGADPTLFAARLADRRAGRPLVLSARTRKEGAPTGLIGLPIIGEAFEEHRKEIENQLIDSRGLAQEARAAIDDFLAHADAPDGWKVLARAAALLTGALDRIAPPYADRVADVSAKDSQWR